MEATMGHYGCTMMMMPKIVSFKCCVLMLLCCFRTTPDPKVAQVAVE